MQVFVDAHVHIYDCFDLDRFLDGAYDNFLRAAKLYGVEVSFLGVLMLTESYKYNYFGKLVDMVGRESFVHQKQSAPKWTFLTTAEPCSLIAQKRGAKLVIIAGRQITSLEDLEVLFLGSQSRVEDGLPLMQILEAAKLYDIIHVIPWGAGKWLFRRGVLLGKIINTWTQDTFYLGDEGGRPIFWPTPRHFRLGEENGIRILPGSDPLPFKREEGKAGSFGFFLETEIDISRPAASLNNLLRNQETKIHRYGDLEKSFRFFRNQIQIQSKKRLRRLSTSFGNFRRNSW